MAGIDAGGAPDRAFVIDLTGCPAGTEVSRAGAVRPAIWLNPAGLNKTE